MAYIIITVIIFLPGAAFFCSGGGGGRRQKPDCAPAAPRSDVRRSGVFANLEPGSFVYVLHAAKIILTALLIILLRYCAECHRRRRVRYDVSAESRIFGAVTVRRYSVSEIYGVFGNDRDRHRPRRKAAL